MNPSSEANGRSRVTYDAIADRAGVSKTTVSLVMRGLAKDRIPEATFRRVHEAANELGYYPNRLIRSMQRGKSETLGIVAPNAALEHAGRILDGIRAQAAELGYGILLGQVSGNAKDERESAHRLLEHRVDGMIRFTGVPDGTEPPAWLTEAVLRGVPCVVVDDVMLEGQIDCVVSDDEPAAYAIVSGLLPGCERIIHFAGDSHRTSGQEREAGFWRAVADSNGTEAEVVSRDYSGRAILEILAEQYSRDRGPDAIFCATDYMALSCVNWLAHHQLGRGVRVAGFGGLLCSELLDIATVRQPFEAMGATAVQQVIRRIQGDASPFQTLRIPAKLSTR